MPCSSEWPSDVDSQRLRDLDLATRVACELARHVSTSQMSAEAKKWVEAHREADRRREERARLEAERALAKRKALAKLTPAERKALGL